jgi:hypothetical protein
MGVAGLTNWLQFIILSNSVNNNTINNFETFAGKVDPFWQVWPTGVNLPSSLHQ